MTQESGGQNSFVLSNALVNCGMPGGLGRAWGRVGKIPISPTICWSLAKSMAIRQY